MAKYEYMVVPAPVKGVKAKGAKTPAARFANALTQVMNEYGAQGWDYVRSDTLPCEERSGLTGKTTNFQNMLVFRRVLEEAPVAAPAPEAEEITEEEPEAPVPRSPEDMAAAAAATLKALPDSDEPPATPVTPVLTANRTNGATAS